MSLRSRQDLKRRRSASTLPVGEAGGVDFISGLSDDLLVRILGLVAYARDTVRTHALSRRWRGLWTGVAALRFNFCTGQNKLLRGADDVAAERYLAFINDALALRAAAKANGSSVVEDLAISFDLSYEQTGQLVPLTLEAAQGWIHYAAQQEVKSFVFTLKVPWRWVRNTQGRDDSDIHPVITLNETDSYAKMETMHLRLGAMELRLPSSPMLLASLSDLSLENINLPAGGGYLLSRLVSSACCPLLHKLRLSKIIVSRKEELLIESATLLELLLEDVYRAQFLELRTPSLQVLHIVDCIGLNGFMFTDPPSRLKDLMVRESRPLRIDGVHGHLSSVEALKIQLFSHGMASFVRNASSIQLLQCCRLTKCLEVFFVVVQTGHRTGSVDIIKGQIPPLPNVTSLSVCLAVWERHTSGPGIASLLAHCSNIQYLSLQLRYCDFTEEKNYSKLDLSCDYSCHWKSHDLSLAHLQEVEFKNLIGSNCEFRFIQSILTGAQGIQKVTISFNQRYWQHAFKVMPPLEGGPWTACDDTSLTYKWRSENLVSESTRL